MNFLRAAVPVVLLAGLAACDPAPTTPSAKPATVAGSTPSARPAPSRTTAAEPSASARSRPASASPRPASVRPRASACPATAAALQKAAKLSRQVRIDADHIKCARRWATAGLIAVDPATQGDGVILFEYERGAWTKVTEGSALVCRRYGIPEEIGDQVGCHN
jgi:hypothetical protein